jgi:hypothetical protein
MVIGLTLAAWAITGAKGAIATGVTIGAGLIVVGMAWGAKACRRFSDSVIEPGSVESARGST